MKAATMSKAAAVLLSAFLLPTTASAQSSDDWEFGLTIYGWFPDISGKTSFPPPTGGNGEFTVDIGQILDNLQFTFQGSFDARKGHWGIFTDVVYMDLGKNLSNVSEGTVGGSQIPYDVTGSVNFDMKSWIWTTAAYYRMAEDQGSSVDFLFGARYNDVDQKLKLELTADISPEPPLEFSGETGLAATSWDAIIGFRGRYGLGADGSWYIPYYLDVGTGDSDLTWQALAGLGYAFHWGELAAVWRYLDYDQADGKPLADMNFSGPEVGVVFRW